MNHTAEDFLRAAGMDDKADEMRRQMYGQDKRYKIPAIDVLNVAKYCGKRKQCFDCQFYGYKHCAEFFAKKLNEMNASIYQRTDCRECAMHDHMDHDDLCQECRESHGKFFVWKGLEVASDEPT